MIRWMLSIVLLLAAVPANTQTVGQVFFILRPDVNGIWSIQDDVDHASFGGRSRMMLTTLRSVYRGRIFCACTSTRYFPRQGS